MSGYIINTLTYFEGHKEILLAFSTPLFGHTDLVPLPSGTAIVSSPRPHTISCTMRAEAVLLRARLAAKLILTPRELSSDCGIALRFDRSQNDQVCALLKKAHVETAGIHLLVGK